jgi:hypothetical protein
LPIGCFLLTALITKASITTRFLSCSEFSIHYDMFRQINPYSGNTQVYIIFCKVSGTWSSIKRNDIYFCIKERYIWVNVICTSLHVYVFVLFWSPFTSLSLLYTNYLFMFISHTNQYTNIYILKYFISNPTCLSSSAPTSGSLNFVLAKVTNY